MLALLTAVMLSGAEMAPATATIQEWPIPWERSRPRDPYVAAPDEVWFVGQQSDYAAILTPSSGAIKRIDLPAGAGPHNIIVDQRGAWYAGNKGAHLGLIDRDTHAIRQFTLPGEGRRDIHTMDFDTVTGDLWFTVQGGNQIGQWQAETQQFTLWDVPTTSARPYGLQFFGGQPWVVLFGSNKLATIADGELQEIQLPRDNNRPRRLHVDEFGHVYYVDYVGGYLGRYNPASGEIKEWAAPSGLRSMPYAMAGDNNDYIWFVETGVQPNQLVGFNKTSETFTKPVVIPSGGGSVRHMVYDASDDSLWFGTDTNTIGKATLRYNN